MDEYKDTTQQVQEEQEAQKASVWNYPFIVEITAAMLLDSCGLKEAKQWAEDPALLNNIHVLIDFVAGMSQKLNNEDPELAREGSPFMKFYAEIPGYRPELDPESRAFDPAQYAAAIDEMGQEAFLEGVGVRFAEMIKEQEAITEMLPELEGFAFEMQKTLASLYEYLNSDRFLEVIRTAREKAGVPAVKPQFPTVLNEKQMLSLKSKVMDVFSRVRFSDAERGVVTLEIDDKKYKFTFTNFNKLKGTSGISTHKLLRVALSQFTQNNHYGATSGIKYRVDIPLKEYARALGYKIDVDPTAKDQDKEKSRASEELKNARKRIRQDLDILFACRAEWKEVVKGNAGDFGKCQFFDRVSIHNGIITLDFGRYISDNYLSKLPLTYFPLALLSIDGRNENAYQIGLAISDHYNNIYNHIGTGNPSLLSVKTLLDKTTLPTIETVRKNRRSWEERIKEPFETALDKLYQAGVISDWKYSKAKDEDLTDAEAAQIDSYETFSSLFVHYEIKDPANLDEAIDKKRAQIAARAASKKNRARTEKRGKLLAQKG